MEWLNGIWVFFKELFFNDWYMKWFFRITFSLLLIFLIVQWVHYEQDAAKGIHSKFLWCERNIPKPEKVFIHDTIPIHDTIVKNIKIYQNGHTVTSYGQKGGQTAETINNK